MFPENIFQDKLPDNATRQASIPYNDQIDINDERLCGHNENASVRTAH
jgi:hypothetical protein